MSYCVNCGVELDPSLKSCPLCHTPVINPNELKKEVSSSPYPTQKGQVEVVKRKDWGCCSPLLFWPPLSPHFIKFTGLFTESLVGSHRRSLRHSLDFTGSFCHLQSPANLCVHSIGHSGRWHLSVYADLPDQFQCLVFPCWHTHRNFNRVTDGSDHCIIPSFIYFYSGRCLIHFHCYSYPLHRYRNDCRSVFDGKHLSSWSMIVLTVCVIIDITLITVISRSRLRNAVRRRLHF